MRIVIDCRMINMSGIGTYLKGILPFFIETENEFLLIGKEENLKEYKKVNVKILNLELSIFSIREFFLFPVKYVNKYDAFYSPNYNIPSRIKIPIYATIHDVLFFDFPELVRSRIGRIARFFFVYRVLKLSKKIFTVSEFSKERINKHTNTGKEIVVTYNGVSQKLKDRKLKNELPIINGKYIVFVGNIKKHKGLKNLLDAFIKVLKIDNEIKLVLVGSSQNFKTKDNDTIYLLSNIEKYKEKIIITGHIDDEKLYNIIKNCFLLVQPSLYEGFGIPPLEALYLGKNVVISDIPVFKEIYNDLPVNFFKANEHLDLFKVIEEFELVDLDIENIRKIIDKKFSYEKVARLILNEIEELV